MTGVLDRQEVIAVLDQQQVGASIPPNLLFSYRETVADALMALAETRAAFVQVRCTDSEDYARIFNEGYDEATRQLSGELAMAKADALREAAAEQRRLAADAHTNDGEAEHTDIADWLEERADELAGQPAPTCVHVCEHLYENECIGQPRPCRTREQIDADVESAPVVTDEAVDKERTDARPGWLQKMAGDVNATQATAQQLAAEVVDLSHAYPVPLSLVEVCSAYDSRGPAASSRSEAEVKAEALREAADTVNWAKVMSPYRALRERADDLEAAAPLLDPRPLLDRAALDRRLETAKGHGWSLETTVDAVLELARPMPTREELAAAGHRWSCLKRDEPVHALDAIDYDRADEILEIWALLNGAQS